MTPEKMTDEQVRKVLALVATAHPDCARSMGAHLATLEAELDDARQEATDDRESLEEVLAERDALRKRCDAANKDLDEAHRGQDRAEGEAVRLRERVQALEAEVESRGRCIDGIDSMLEKACAAGWECFPHTRRQRIEMLERDESRLSGIFQRAGDVIALRRVAEDAMENRKPRLSDAAKAVARYVVGEDGAGAAKAHDHSYMAGCNDFCPPASPESTTAEDFATVRAAIPLSCTDQNKKASAALSRLARRMGAMGCLLRRIAGTPSAAIEDTDRLETNWMTETVWRDDGADDTCPTAAEVRDALTDAPAVFTLEEVKAAMTAQFGPAHPDVRKTLERLAAMRR